MHYESSVYRQSENWYVASVDRVGSINGGHIRKQTCWQMGGFATESDAKYAAEEKVEEYEARRNP